VNPDKYCTSVVHRVVDRPTADMGRTAEDLAGTVGLGNELLPTDRSYPYQSVLADVETVLRHLDK